MEGVSPDAEELFAGAEGPELPTAELDGEDVHPAADVKHMAAANRSELFFLICFIR